MSRELGIHMHLWIPTSVTSDMFVGVQSEEHLYLTLEHGTAPPLAHACPPCDLERSPGNNWFSLNFIRTPFHLVKGRIIMHFWKKPLPQKTRVVSLSTQDREGGTLWLSWWETVGQLWTTGGFQVSLCPLEVCLSCFPPSSPSLPESSLPLYGVRCPGLGWRWLKAMRSSHIYLLASPFLQDTYVPPARQRSRVRFMGGRLRRCGR